MHSKKLKGGYCNTAFLKDILVISRFVATFAIVVMFSIVGYPGDLFGDTKRKVSVHKLSVPGNRVLEITVPAQWRKESEKPPKGISPKNAMSYIFSPHKRDNDAFLFRVNIFRFTQFKRKELIGVSKRIIQGGAKKNPECKTGNIPPVRIIQGENGHGHYYQGGSRTKYGCEYKTVGDMVVDNLNVQFIFINGKRDSAEERAAVAAIKGAKLRSR